MNTAKNESNCKNFFFYSFAEIEDSTSEHFIKLLLTKLQICNETIRNHTLLQALLELNIQNDDDFEVLSDKYKNLLKNKRSHEENFKNESFNLQRLINVVTDFYVDRSKLKGINAKNKIELLRSVLERNKADDIIRFFCEIN